jgi:hypothetical protein
MQPNRQRLSATDTIAIITFTVALIGVAAVLLQPAYPEASIWVYRSILWFSIITALLSAAFLINHHLVQPRLKGRKLDPFLTIGIVATLAAFVSLVVYAIRSSQPIKELPAGSKSDKSFDQSAIKLLPPKDRYDIKWDTARSMQINIQREGKPVEFQYTYNPAFILQNTASVPIQDAAFTWRLDLSGLEGLSKIGTLSRQDVSVKDNAFILTRKTPGIGGWVYPIKTLEEGTIPFVTKDIELYVPTTLSGLLGVFVAAKMPDQLGSKTEAVPMSVSITWNLPTAGTREFKVRIWAVNTKPAGLPDAPEIMGRLEFEVETGR